MDHFINIGEFGFDDNGLKNAVLLATRKKIACSNCINDEVRKESKVNNCDAKSTGRDEEKSWGIFNLPVPERNFVPLCGYPLIALLSKVSRTVGLHYEEIKLSFPYTKNESGEKKETRDLCLYKLNDAIAIPYRKKVNKQKVEHLLGRNGTKPTNVGTEETKCRPGRSAKDGGCSDLPTCTMSCMPPSLSYFGGTSIIAATTLKFLITFTVGSLLLSSAGVDGALTSVPVNTLFSVGETIRMNCSTDRNRPVYWVRTPAGSDVQQWLYYGKNGFNSKITDDRFSIDKDEATGRYDIIIATVQLNDAGKYSCIDESGIGAMASAELIVSDPMKCNSKIPTDGVMGYNVFDIPQDFVEVSCSLSFTGNLSPALEWSLSGSDIQNGEHNASATTSSITSTLKWSPTREHNNTRFQCKANIKGAAQIKRDSRLYWESETVRVKYAEFASEEVESCPDIKWNLLCNPQCSYQFECADNACQCLYTYYDTRTSRKYKITSDVVKYGTFNDILLAGMVAAAGLAAGAVLTTIVLACLLKKKSVKRPPSADSLELATILARPGIKN